LLQTRNKDDMAAIPAAANLPGMKTPTYEDYLADPAAVRAELHRAATRARDEAIYRHAIVPFARFCGRLLAVRGIRMQLDPRPLVAR
jgi:hypothetical protein